MISRRGFFGLLGAGTVATLTGCEAAKRTRDKIKDTLSEGPKEGELRFAHYEIGERIVSHLSSLHTHSIQNSIAVPRYERFDGKAWVLV